MHLNFTDLKSNYLALASANEVLLLVACVCNCVCNHALFVSNINNLEVQRQL